MNLSERERVACELLGIASLEAGGYAPCPGEALHTKGSGRRDFRVTLETVPTGFCFHSSCSAEVEEFNLRLRRAIWKLENGEKRSPASAYGVTAAAPKGERVVKRPPFDLKKLEEMAGNVREVITREWLMAVSPMEVVPGMRGVGDTFLEALYEVGEKVLIFTKFTSQGDFGYHVGGSGWRLGRERGVRPVRSELPLGGPDGVWFLCNPVSGEWKINADAVGHDGQAKWGRRHGACVTAWRYLVLENDVAPMGEWLRLLVQLPLRVVAIYTSGSRSVHALVRVDAASKADWDVQRDLLVQLLAPLGADPAAMTAVRLTRLPGCLRGDSLQELWYLDPRPRANTNILQRRMVRR